MEFNGLTQDDLLFGGLPQSFQLPALATTFDPSEDQQHYLSTITGSNLKRKDSNSDESSSPPQVAKKQRTEPVTPTCSTTEDIEPPLQRVPPSQNGLSSFNEMDVLSGKPVVWIG